MKMSLRVSALSAALVTAGCVSVLPKAAAPNPRYTIEAVDADRLAGPAVDWALGVEDPRASRAYDTEKIAVSTAPGKIEYFAAAEWADRAPRLFHTALMQSFEDSNRILSVGDRAVVPLGDIVLWTDIREIELDVRDKAPAAAVSVFARLTDGRGKIYAARRFDVDAPAASDGADDVVGAFDAAFDDVIADIVKWTFDEGAAAVRGK